MQISQRIVRCLLTASTSLAIWFAGNQCFADSRVYEATVTSIVADKSCSQSSEISKIKFVIEKDANANIRGWFYGNETFPAVLLSSNSEIIEVIYPITQSRKLAPSTMKLQMRSDGLFAVISDNIPEDKKLRVEICWHNKIEMRLAQTSESPEKIRMQAQEAFDTALEQLTGIDLLFEEKDFPATLLVGLKIFPIYERLYGKFSKQSVNAMALIVFPLIELERYDEALEIITQFRIGRPNDEVVEDVELYIKKQKKKQDELFRYDPDAENTAELKPIA